jgi:hypothetical protein
MMIMQYGSDRIHCAVDASVIAEVDPMVFV